MVFYFYHFKEMEKKIIKKVYYDDLITLCNMESSDSLSKQSYFAYKQRKQDLEDSLQAQQYFADANEAESWMREKEPIACTQDYGKDEDSSVF